MHGLKTKCTEFCFEDIIKHFVDKGEFVILKLIHQKYFLVNVRQIGLN